MDSNRMVPMPTDEQYSSNPVCPYCGSDKLFHDSVDISEFKRKRKAKLKVEVECMSCDMTYTEFYGVIGFDL